MTEGEFVARTFWKIAFAEMQGYWAANAVACMRLVLAGLPRSVQELYDANDSFDEAPVLGD